MNEKEANGPRGTLLKTDRPSVKLRNRKNVVIEKVSGDRDREAL